VETFTQKLKKPSFLLLAGFLLLSGLMPFIQNRRAHALPTLGSGTFVRLDRLTATTATGGRVCVKPTTAVPNSGKVVVNFPTTAATDYVVNGTATNWTTNTTFESGFTGSAMQILNNRASAVTGKSVEFTLTAAGAMTAGTLYCFNFASTSTLTTSSAGASVTTFAFVKTQNASSTDLDLTYWGVDIISGDTVTVSATVAPFFTLALSGTTDTFATNLSSGSVNTSNGNRYVQVDTNALNGWIVWVKDANFKTTGITDTGSANKHGALTSVMAGGYAISNNTNNALATPNASHAFQAGTTGGDDYGLAVTINQQGSGAGTTSLNTVYDGSTAGNGGVLDPTQYRPIGSSTGTAVAARLNIKMLVSVGVATPPGNDYTDTLEYVGAGQF
jgi:hypothetical protein